MKKLRMKNLKKEMMDFWMQRKTVIVTWVDTMPV